MRTTRFTKLTVVATALALVTTASACSSSGGGSKKSAGKSGAPSCTKKINTGVTEFSGPIAKGDGNSTLPTGKPGVGKPKIVIGSKNFPEEDVLGQLYTQALKAKGYDVTLKSSIGGTEVVDPAMKSGQINMYPEYTGVIYSVLGKRTDTPKSALATYDFAKSFEAKRGFTLLNPTPFQDADGLAVEKSFAQKKCLATIDDLKTAGSFSYTAPPENEKRYQGLLGLQKAYGLSPKFIPLTAGSQYSALDQGKTDSIAIFTTDPQLESHKYAVLTDTKKIFGFQQVAPVVSNKILSKLGPEFQQICNAVSKNLTTATILGMNSANQLSKQDAASVAKKFLQANKLI